MYCQLGSSPKTGPLLLASANRNYPDFDSATPRDFRDFLHYPHSFLFSKLMNTGSVVIVSLSIISFFLLFVRVEITAGTPSWLTQRRFRVKAQRSGTSVGLATLRLSQSQSSGGSASCEELFIQRRTNKDESLSSPR